MVDVATRDAPEVVIKNFIRDAWDSSNTSGVTPEIHHGWVTEDFSKPEVTVSNPEESPIQTGESGYAGLNQDGTPVQYIGGEVDVNCWTHRDASSVNPRKLAFEMLREVQRIVHVTYDGGASDLFPLSYVAGRRFVEEEETPVVYRYQVSVGYGYRTTA